MHRFIGRVFKFVVTLRPNRMRCQSVQVQFQSIVLVAVPIVFALHFVLVDGMRLTNLRFHRS